MEDLGERIFKFLDEYAAIRPDWDPEENDNEYEKYTSPDASVMRYCAVMLCQRKLPELCDSSWGSGGYRPYVSKEGKEEHDYLVKEINKLIVEN